MNIAIIGASCGKDVAYGVVARMPYSYTINPNHKTICTSEI